MEKFWISHSFTTPNVKLSYKNHWHQMGGAALYHCDGIPKTIAGCSNDWNKGTKWSRPWIVGRELPYYREFQGCTVAYVQKCQVTPDSLFAEINHYNWPVSHFNVVMSGSATFKDAILVATGSNNECGSIQTVSGGLKAVANSSFKKCRYFLGSLDDGYAPGTPTRALCNCGSQ